MVDVMPKGVSCYKIQQITAFTEYSKYFDDGAFYQIYLPSTRFLSPYLLSRRASSQLVLSRNPNSVSISKDQDLHQMLSRQQTQKNYILNRQYKRESTWILYDFLKKEKGTRLSEKKQSARFYHKQIRQYIRYKLKDPSLILSTACIRLPKCTTTNNLSQYNCLVLALRNEMVTPSCPVHSSKSGLADQLFSTR